MNDALVVDAISLKVCSYLRGRLHAQKVESLGEGRFRITFKRLNGNGDPQTCEGDLVGICRQYGVDLERVKEVCL